MADERGSDHLARLQSAARSDRILRMEKRRELMRTMSTQWGFGTPEAVTLLERHDRRATGAGVGADGRVSAVARLGLKTGERVTIGAATFARAREASLRAAAGLVSSRSAIIGNSKPKLSWSTKATRSLGVSRSRTTWRATATVSARTEWAAGSALLP